MQMICIDVEGGCYPILMCSFRGEEKKLGCYASKTLQEQHGSADITTMEQKAYEAMIYSYFSGTFSNEPWFREREGLRGLVRCLSSWSVGGVTISMSLVMHSLVWDKNSLCLWQYTIRNDQNETWETS